MIGLELQTFSDQIFYVQPRSYGPLILVFPIGVSGTGARMPSA